MLTINLYLNFRQANYLYLFLYIFNFKLNEEIDLLFEVTNYFSFFFNNLSKNSNKNLLLLLLLLSSLLIYISLNIGLLLFTLDLATSFIINILIIFLESKVTFFQ